MRTCLFKTQEKPEKVVRTPVKAKKQIQTALVGLELGQEGPRRQKQGVKR